MGRKAKHPVRTTAKTLELVEALKEVDRAGVTELADRLGMGKSTVHNHLSTLEEYEYVTRSGDEYELGLRFLELGGHTRNRMKLFQMAKPEIENLAAETGELANVATEEFGECVYLYRSKGDRAVELDTHLGLRMTMHNTALGKAMLAYLPEERVDRILEKHTLTPMTAHSTTDSDELRSQLSEVRERGYALDLEERLEGLRCVAAPVRDSSGSVLGAISISAPTNRLKGDRLQSEIPDLVVSAANVIELNIAHS